ncbi:MAG: Mur ligase family protein [Dongiaceae bacterium]
MLAAKAGYLTGPNLYDDQGGVVVACAPAALPGAGLPGAGRPLVLDRARVGHVLALPGLPGLAEPWMDAAARGAAGLLDLVPRLAAALLRPFSVRAPAARLLESGADRLLAFVRCEHPELGTLAWECATRAIEAGLGGEARWAAFAEAHRRFAGAAARLAADPTTALLAREADRLGIPWTRPEIPGQALQLGQGARHCLLGRASDAADWAPLAARLRAAGIPVPAMAEVSGADAAVAAAERLGFPVLLSIARGGPGRSAPLADAAALRAACAAVAGARAVLVEKPAAGRSHHALVVGGRLVSLVLQLRPRLEGDGRHSVAALVERLDADPRRRPGCDNLLAPVQPDAAVLAAQGLTLDSVPEAGRRVVLGLGSGTAAGGMAEDATEALHPDNRALIERAAALLDLPVVGVELAIEDAARSWREGGLAVLGLGARPDLRPHRLASPGRSVAEPILRALLPAGTDGRIPTCAVTGSVGKTTTCNMVARILGGLGLTVGRCSTAGISVGEERLRTGDLSGGWPARLLLLDRRVEAGVFELARGGLLNDGMVVEAVDVAAILNVYDNHIGWDGVESRDELARIKGILARRARRLLALNAEDPLCLAMRRDSRAERLCLVAKDAANPALAAHRAAGGTAVTLRGTGMAGTILLTERGIETAVVEPRTIPATLGGRHGGKVWNAMFAVALAHGLGIAPERIRAGLQSFRPTFADSQGHFTVIEGHPFRLILDHNLSVEPMVELAATVRATEVPGRKRACLMASMRMTDRLVRAVARTLAGAFDDYACANWDKRPREDPDELPRLLREGLVEGGVPPEAIRCFRSEAEAVRHTLGSARPGDLVVINTAEPEMVLGILEGRPAPEAGAAQ